MRITVKNQTSISNKYIRLMKWKIYGIKEKFDDLLYAEIFINEEAEKWDKLVLKTLEIIEYFKPKYFFIENPRGILRKMPFMESIPRHTVTYCQYWDTRMKPTDIWTNSSSWTPRPMCKNWDSCHESAPRWSKTWTQGKKNAYERSIIPYQLCKEILLTCK